MKTYSEKLRDPRWQRKRLEVLNRDDFTCQLCGAKETELHVHHEAYKKGANPWEYDNSWLITYCKYCHIIFQSFEKQKIGVIQVKRVNDFFLVDSFYYTTEMDCESELYIYKLNKNSDELDYIYNDQKNKINLFQILNLIM